MYLVDNMRQKKKIRRLIHRKTLKVWAEFTECRSANDFADSEMTFAMRYGP